MNVKEINRFFKILSRKLDGKTKAILTGAAAGAIWGNVRLSMDLDFAIETAIKTTKRDPQAWVKLEKALEETVKLTGFKVDYAEDIDRWGLVVLLDYKKRSLPYRRFGLLEVRLMDPAYWSIGKMTRYLHSDHDDMAKVFKNQKVSWNRLVRVWGKALRESPHSGALAAFRRQVEHFLRSYGRWVWGREFSAEKAVRAFHKNAGIKKEFK